MKHSAPLAYKDTGAEWLGQVPQHWEVKQLKWAVTFQRGHDLPDDSREAGTVPIVSSGGVSGYHNVARASGPGIVTGRYGTIGEFELVSSGYWPLNTALYSIDLYGNSAAFLRYMLQNLAPLFILNSLKSAVPGVDRNDIHPIPVALPPVPEQHAITAYLDRETARLDALMAAKERLLEVLAEKRRVLITRAVTRGLDRSAPLRDSGLPWLGEIPTHWCVERLRWSAIRLEQGWSPQAEEREPDENEWAVLKLNAVNSGEFDSSKIKALPPSIEAPGNLEVHVGDFLITRANTPELVGDVCYVEQTRPRLILSDLIYRLQLDARRLDGRYLNLFLLTPVGRRQIEADARGSSASMVKISQEHIKNWVVPLPPLSEQHAIVAHITKETTKLDALREATERTIGLLKERRAALIAAAVTGKINPETITI